MIELVISVCLIDEPSRCKDVNMTYMADSVTPHQCMLYGQSEIAKWVEGHPKWKVTKWRCGRVREMAKA